MSVARTTRLSSSLLRVTFTGESLQHIGTEGLDQRIKILLPIEATGFGDYGLLDETPDPERGWYARWRELPDEQRNPMRTYTLRNPRPAEREIDVDFVLHGDGGPASAWATAAAPGDEVVIVGPDGRSGQRAGIEWSPGDATRVLLAGDETALPAIVAIVESLPAGIRGQAFIEVPHEDDAIGLVTDSAVQVTWLPREHAPLGARLEVAVREWAATNVTAHTGEEPEAVDIEEGILWEVPQAPLAPTPAAEGADDLYAWLAGEAALITGLRRHLVRDVGLDRRQIAFMGYWRLGRSEN